LIACFSVSTALSHSFTGHRYINTLFQHGIVVVCTVLSALCGSTWYVLQHLAMNFAYQAGSFEEQRGLWLAFLAGRGEHSLKHGSAGCLFFL
jgi:hypothetical protein